MHGDNLILKTDSYKLTHGAMYPDNTKGVYSYLEARAGARDPYTVFFGLQPILFELAELRVTEDNFNEARMIADIHLGPGIFNEKGWRKVIDVYDGALPLKIKAVPEGTPVPVGNVMMTVENTDPDLYWLTNALESKLLHVWAPTTIATTSREVKSMYMRLLKSAGHTDEEIAGAIDFMLHDFGYRGVSSDQSAASGGAAHLTSFKGTDTLLALTFAHEFYNASYETLAFSVPATEHSIMTSEGKLGEYPLVDHLLNDYPTGILSLVGDSYNIFEFTKMIGTTFHNRIMERDGKVVVRPDSGDALTQIPELLNTLWGAFGGTTTKNGFRVLDPHVGVLWGDGLDGPDEIERIILAVMSAGFSPINLVFGMGGGLLQKINRDTERFAFKCSAQKRNGVWIPIQKDPLDKTKASKPGRLKLVLNEDGEYMTREQDGNDGDDVMVTVFENGRVEQVWAFDEVRERAAL